MTDYGEFGWIAELKSSFGDSPESLSFQDDGAIISCADEQLVIVKDLMQAGVHLLDTASPFALVCKTLRSNLSDLAAMGAKPRHYLLGLAMPTALSDTQVSELITGLRQEHLEFGIQLIGGDTTRANGAMLVSITAIGEISNNQLPMRRSGAVKGDDLWVTGALGDAALGLAIMSGRRSSATGTSPEEQYVISRYLRPEPRIDVGLALASLASAAIDISDGISADCEHLAKASGLAALINVDTLPRSEAFREILGPDPNPKLEWEFLNGGDDYELLFTAAPDRREEVIAISDRLDLPITRIGLLQAGEGISLHNSSGVALNLPLGGFTHF